MDPIKPAAGEPDRPADNEPCDPYDPDDGDAGPIGFDDSDSDADADGPMVPAHEGAASASYEELCREHVESCLQAQSSYLEDLELLKRVSCWRDRVEPLLFEEDQRDAFDIHECEARILNNFQRAERATEARAKQAKRGPAAADGEGSVLPFAELAQCSEPYEVCRMFLAALQLTNDRNVDVIAEGSVEDGSLSLNFQLLSGEMKQLALENVGGNN